MSVVHDSAVTPILALELIREHYGKLPCDRRSSISQLSKSFTRVDFGLCEDDDDVLWTDQRESHENLLKRGCLFLKWILQRPESCVAVVSHGGFLSSFFSLIECLRDDTLTPKRSLSFANGEVFPIIAVSPLNSLLDNFVGNHLFVNGYLQIR